ncbi:MAG: bifunctional hydroxymethylpyrimidine kinase/phosphomethylpyrimidine kinase [Candidatus Bathyarchaeia archaeon]
MRLREIPCALTIAGSDSGGGAGIEADLKTFATLQVYGTCAITAITAQDTREVHAIFPIPADLVKKQVETIFADFQVNALKTGMLYTQENVHVVADLIGKSRLKPVIDTVFAAGSGKNLILDDALDALIHRLIPKALVITPNIPEAEVITGIKINTVEDMKDAAARIAKLGPKAVVIKGGHLKGRIVTDIFFFKNKFQSYSRPRIEVKAHGSGCAFSAAITAYLAKKLGVPQAVALAEQFIENALTSHLKVGKGRPSVNPLAILYNEAEKFRVIEETSTAVRIIEDHPEFTPHIPEVGMQVAMALPFATSPQEVAAIEGRIIRFANRPKAVGGIKFGASSHIARVILTAMRYNPNFRAAMNIRYAPELIDAFKKLNFNISSFDRALEKPEVKLVEGGTLVWGIEQAIRMAKEMPNVIFDLGEIGKEPMIRVLGKTATEVVLKTLSAINALKKTSRKRQG